MIQPVKLKHWRKLICFYLNLSTLFRGRFSTPAVGGEWPNRLKCCNHISRIGQTPLRAVKLTADDTSSLTSRDK